LAWFSRLRDALLERARTTFDQKAQDGALKKVHEKIVDDALFPFAHDVAAPPVDQGHGLRAGPELVPGLLADHDEAASYSSPPLAGARSMKG
jgi:hypothetical protein